jgi:hypothetical protein
MRWLIVAILSVVLGVASTWGLRNALVDIGVDIEGESPGELSLVWSDGEVVMEPIAKEFSPHHFNVSITSPELKEGQTDSGYQLIAMAGVEHVDYNPADAWVGVSNYFLLSSEVRPAVLTLEGWNLGNSPYLAFESDSYSGKVQVQSTEAEPIELDLYSEKRDRVTYAIQSDQQIHRYYAQVPRKALSDMRLKGASAQRFTVQRLFINTYFPCVYYRDLEVNSPRVGYMKKGWRGEWDNDSLVLPKILFLGARIPFTLLATSLMASMFCLFVYALFRVVRHCVRQGLAEPSEELLQEPLSWKTVLVFWIPMALVWMVFLICFYPGTMNVDSLSQWKQAHDFSFEPQHPPFYALIMWGLSKIWDSPFSVTSLQVIFGSGVLALGFSLLWQAKIYRWAILLMYGVAVISPRNNTMIISLIKDTPYAIAMMAMTVFLSWILLRRQQNNWFQWAALGFSMAMAMLFRHNGPLMVAAFLPLLLILSLRTWKGWCICTAITVTIFLGVKVLVMSNIPMEKGDGGLHDLTTAHLAILVDRDVPMSNAEYALLKNVRSLDDRWAYDKRRVAATTMPLIGEDIYNRLWAKEHTAAYRPLYISMMLRNPLIGARYFWDRGSFMYIPWETETPLETFFLGITKNDQGLYPNHIFLTMSEQIRAGLVLTSHESVRWLFWYPGLPLYLVVLAGGFICYLKRDVQWILVYLPFILNTGVLTVAAISHTARYQFPLTFAAGFLIVLGGCHCCTKKTADINKITPADVE